MTLWWHIFTGICLPILIVVGVGWCVQRRFRMELGTLVKLNLYLLVPCFIFVRLASSKLSLQEGWSVFSLMISLLALLALSAMLLARLTKAESARGRALRMSAMFSNAGNYGIPLITLAFGQNAQEIQVFVVLSMNLSMFTIGVMLSQGSVSLEAWKKLLRMPSLYAAFLGLCVRYTEFPIQEMVWLWDPLTMLADLLVGMALLTLGAQLAVTRFPKVGMHLVGALGLKLLAAPLMAWGLCQLWELSPEAMAVVVTASAAPTAVNAVLLAHEFKADHEFTSAAVFLSTLMSFLTVSLVIAFLR